MVEADELSARARADLEARAVGEPVVDVGLRIGGRTVRIRTVGESLARVLLAPIGHLATGEPPAEPALTVSCWSSPGTSGLADFLPAPGATAERVRYAALEDDRCVMAWPAERLVQGYSRGDDGDEAWWWVPDVDGVSIAELAMPFRPLLHWWAERSGLLMVHAAAVGTTQHGAVLLAGVSGSGKSTTSLWALRSPTLRFLGDDYVLVDPGPPARVFSLYTTAKIHEPDQGRVPHVRAEVVGRQEDDKLVAFLGRRFADRIIEQLPLAAILLPRLTDAGPRITSVGPAEALRRLAPSTLLQFPGAQPQRSLAALGALTRAVPARDFALGPDPAATPACIEAFLAATGAVGGGR